MLPWLKKDISIAVIGDLILDEYLDGSVTRISPEAPVPVHLVNKALWSAGGAANTARNIQLAGGRARLYGVWGQDEAAAILGDLLGKDEIDLRGVLQLADRPTIKKTRITAGHQQMLRVDWEKAQAIGQEQQREILAQLQRDPCDAVLTSDYAKGCLPEALVKEIFAFAQGRGVPCVVDPKGKNFHKYRGCTLITPNRREAMEALGLDSDESLSGEELGLRLQQEFGLADVLVTMGAAGMVYVPHDRSLAAIHRAPHAREVFDVSGAGDTVAALMSLALAAGEGVALAMDYANLAAGIVVEKWGTQPVYRHELEDAVSQGQLGQGSAQEDPLASPKIVSLKRLQGIVNEATRRGKRFVFTNGCFDLMHAGHLSYLEKARALGDCLIVAVNTDASVAELKGPTRPIVPLAERMKLLSGFACVDYVLAFGEATPLMLIEALLPQVLVKGADYQVDSIVGADAVRAAGGEVKTLAFVEGLSSSHLMQRIRERTGSIGPAGSEGAGN